MHRSRDGGGEQGDEVLLEALRYHARGWSIIPIKAGTKTPAVRWKSYQSTRPDDARLRRWFASGRYAGLAVIVGAVSGGLGCRDFDTMESYERWAADSCDGPGLADSGRGLVYAATAGAFSASYWSGER